ncbi:hypothetical protein ACWD1Y_23305 [Streptomyces sp. NPDC002814]
MNEHGFLESTKQFALYLSELQNSLDPESYDRCYASSRAPTTP